MLLRNPCVSLLVSVGLVGGSVACNGAPPEIPTTARAQSGLVLRAPASKKTTQRTGITHWHTIVEKGVVVIDGSDAKGKIRWATAFRMDRDGETFTVENFGQKKGSLVIDRAGGLMSNTLPIDSWPLYAASFAVDWHAHEQVVPYGFSSKLASTIAVGAAIAGAVAAIATGPVWVSVPAGVVGFEALASAGIVSGAATTHAGVIPDAVGATLDAASTVADATQAEMNQQADVQMKEATDAAQAAAIDPMQGTLDAIEATLDASARAAAEMNKDSKASDAMGSFLQATDGNDPTTEPTNDTQPAEPPSAPEQGQPLPADTSGSNLDSTGADISEDTSSEDTSSEVASADTGGDTSGAELAAAKCRKTSCSKTTRVCLCLRY